MFNGAGSISNDVFRKLPGDSTTRCYDNGEPSGRKIGGLFCARRIVPACRDTLAIAVLIVWDAPRSAARVRWPGNRLNYVPEPGERVG
jgi:hypothetical protein